MGWVGLGLVTLTKNFVNSNPMGNPKFRVKKKKKEKKRKKKETNSTHQVGFLMLVV